MPLWLRPTVRRVHLLPTFVAAIGSFSPPASDDLFFYFPRGRRASIVRLPSSKASCMVHHRPLTSAVFSAALLQYINDPFLTSPLYASNAHSNTYVLATHVSLVVGMTPCPLPSHLQSHFNYKRVHEVHINYKRVHEVDKGLFAVYPPAGCSFRSGLAVRSIGFSFSHSRSGGQDIEDGAMSRANTMFDFFAMEKTRSCARGAKLSAISRIDPQLLRRVIASTLPPPSSQLFPSPPPPPLPILDPSCRSVATAESDSSSAPLTIFYNGTVSVFDLAEEKAEAVMKLAERTMDYRLLAQLNEELLPIPRKKSLQRFLEKRQQRLTAKAPYTADHEAASAKTTALDALTHPTSDAFPRLAIIGGAKNTVQNTN
ncbi:unnamed protein product [Musa acuminata var. zebrina]